MMIADEDGCSQRVAKRTAEVLFFLGLKIDAAALLGDAEQQAMGGLLADAEAHEVDAQIDALFAKVADDL